MQSYKIGNKIDGIIRSYVEGPLGSIDMLYGNQPYTILHDIEATVNFQSEERNLSVMNKNILNYENNKIDSVKLSDVELNDKILNLIFLTKKDKGLFHKVENLDSDDEGNIYLSTQADTYYQVFIYDDTGELENAYGSLDSDIIQVNKPNSNYLIVYGVLADVSYALDKPDNYYVTLDLMITGNIDDATSDMCIHFDKCALRASQDMMFRSSTNTVDLNFTVIHTENDYITLK